MMTKTLEEALVQLQVAVDQYQRLDGDDLDLARVERKVLVAAAVVAGAASVEVSA